MINNQQLVITVCPWMLLLVAIYWGYKRVNLVCLRHRFQFLAGCEADRIAWSVGYKRTRTKTMRGEKQVVKILNAVITAQSPYRGVPVAMLDLPS